MHVEVERDAVEQHEAEIGDVLDVLMMTQPQHPATALPENPPASLAASSSSGTAQPPSGGRVLPRTSRYFVDGDEALRDLVDRVADANEAFKTGTAGYDVLNSSLTYRISELQREITADLQG